MSVVNQAGDGPAAVQVVVFPRPTATSEELRALGEALAGWMGAAEGDGRCPVVSPGGLDDLLEGELPQPLLLQETRQAERLTEESQHLLKELGVKPDELWSNLSLQEVMEFERPGAPSGERERQRERLGRHATLRVVRFVIPGDATNRAEVVEDLRRAIGGQPGLDQVYVDGCSLTAG